MNRPIVVAAALLLVGCASTGVQVKPEQLQAFQPGVTTYADVVHELGPPTHSTIQSDGTRMAMYVYGHAQVRAATFVPIVGAFAGGADTSHSSVAIFFDQAGKLIRYIASEGAMGSTSGIADAVTTEHQTPAR